MRHFFSSLPVVLPFKQALFFSSGLFTWPLCEKCFIWQFPSGCKQVVSKLDFLAFLSLVSLSLKFFWNKSSSCAFFSSLKCLEYFSIPRHSSHFLPFSLLLLYVFSLAQKQNLLIYKVKNYKIYLSKSPSEKKTFSSNFQKKIFPQCKVDNSSTSLVLKLVRIYCMF